MKHLRLWLLVLVSVSFSCIDREFSLLVKGKITDEKTQAAIPNKEVIVLALSESEDKIVSKNIGYFYTDSAGNFNFPLRNSNHASLYEFCVVGDTAYASSNLQFSQFDLKWNNASLHLTMTRLTDFEIKLERQCQNPKFDTLYISWTSNGKEGKNIYPYKIVNYWSRYTNKVEFIGGPINAVLKTKVYADRKTLVHYKLFRNGKYISLFDTLFCKKDMVNTVHFTY